MSSNKELSDDLNTFSYDEFDFFRAYQYFKSYDTNEAFAVLRDPISQLSNEQGDYLLCNRSQRGHSVFKGVIEKIKKKNGEEFQKFVDALNALQEQLENQKVALEESVSSAIDGVLAYASPRHLSTGLWEIIIRPAWRGDDTNSVPKPMYEGLVEDWKLVLTLEEDFSAVVIRPMWTTGNVEIQILP